MRTRFSIVAALLLAAAPLQAAELIVTASPTKAGVDVAFDLVSEGDVAGISFKLNVPGIKGDDKELNSCTAELPVGFDGACKVHDGFVMVFAASSSPELALPAGVNPLGKISLQYAPGADSSKQAITVDRLDVVDNDAKALPVSVTVEKE